MAAPLRNGTELSDLLVGIVAVPAQLNCRIQGLALDSRQIRPGDCFIALKGLNQHGASFARAAVAAGAVAVLVEELDLPLSLGVPVIPIEGLRAAVGTLADRVNGSPSRRMNIIAVTGTNGKTTVAYLCAQALSALGQACGYLGTLGYGRLYALTNAPTTTPDQLTLHRTLRELLADGATAAAIEVSSHALTQGRINDLAIDVAIFTGLGHDHLDYHASLAAYAQAKKSLFHVPGLRYAVVNVDDALGREIATELGEDIECWTYAHQPRADSPVGAHAITVRELSLRRDGLQLRLLTPSGEAVIDSPLLGDFNAQNLLASLAALLALHVPLHDACAVLSRAQPAPGRMEHFGGEDRLPMVVVDYAHSPDSLERVLSNLRGFGPRRLHSVFGCGGDRDRSKRPLMGEIAERLADTVILTADNPRGEDNTNIIADILRGTRNPANIGVVPDRAAAIRTAITNAHADDIVLIAGKGHESEQITGTLRAHFSDREVVMDVLKRHHS